MWVMNAESSLVSPSKWHFKIISSVQLWHWLWALYSVSPDQWTCTDFPSVTDEWPLQVHLPSKTSLTQALSLRILTQWMCRIFPSITNEQHSQDHLSSRNPLTWALSLGGPDQWMCSVFHSATNKQPFQDHLLSKIMVSIWWAMCPCRLNNECAESPPVSLMNSLLKTIYQVQLYLLRRTLS